MFSNNVLCTISIDSDYKSITISIELIEPSLKSRVLCKYVLNIFMYFQVIYTATDKTILLVTTSTVSVIVVIVIIVICLVVSSIVYLKKKHQLHEVGGERVGNY